MEFKAMKLKEVTRRVREQVVQGQATWPLTFMYRR